METIHREVSYPRGINARMRDFSDAKESTMGLRMLRSMLYLLGRWIFASSVLAANAPIIPPPPDIAASSYLLLDADTHKVLVEHNLHEPLPPASLTKIMTSYLAAVELAAGRISESDQVPISVKAWQTPGSRINRCIGSADIGAHVAAGLRGDSRRAQPIHDDEPAVLGERRAGLGI